MTDRSVSKPGANLRHAGRAASSQANVSPAPLKATPAQKTETILDAARAVFSRHGFEGTTVDAVAAEAGIAKGTVYLYFKSKDELYIAALVRDIERLAHRSKDEMARHLSFRDKMAAYLRTRLEYARQHEDFLRIYLAEQGNMFIKAPTCKELRRVQRETLAHVASLVEEAQRAGEIRDLPAHAVAATMGDIARGLMERRLLGWKEFQPDDEIDFAISVLWKGIAQPKKTKKDV